MTPPRASRVDPFGALFAAPARGTLMGNRGGRLHVTSRALGTRRWASRQWICCVLDLQNRHRTVWGDSYTELFFLDEPTAFAVGHRPCFECRHADAVAFAQAFGDGVRTRAEAMDRVLHAQRLDGRVKRLHRLPVGTLPDGAAIVSDGAALMLKGGRLLRWSPAGYRDAGPRPAHGEIDVLTPPAILDVLRRGYAPLWHPSA